MRILFLTNSIGFGGAEKIVAFVANGLKRHGHNISIINFNSIGNYINTNQQIFEKGINIYTFESNNITTLLLRLRKIWFTYDIAKKNQPDILVGFTSFPNYVAKIVGALLHVPSIMSERGNPYITINKKNIHSLMELAVINRSAGAVFQIDGAAKFYSSKLQKRGIIIPNPIFIKEDIKPIGFSDREKTVVSVGRLDNEQKRYDIMIKAFAIFTQKFPDWTLKLYGDGPDVNLIKHWCKDAGIEEKVKFMGVSKRPMADINNAGMFLITSDFEGISNSLLEAMAIGLPCVSTDSMPGGARMLIENRKNGLLVPIQDIKAIAKAMCEYVENPQLANICGVNAKNVILRFNPEQILDKWEKYLESIHAKKDYRI